MRVIRVMMIMMRMILVLMVMMMMMMMIVSGNTAIASRCLQKDQSAILYSAPEPPKYSLTSP